MLRLIADLSALFLFLIPFGIPALILAWIIGLFNSKAKGCFTFRYIRLLFRIMCFLSGAKITIRGLENLPGDDTPVLYVSNHRSYFDVITGIPMLKTATVFVAKKEFASVPLFKLWMQNMRCILIDRSSPRKGLPSILAAAEEIRSGTSVWIFPEGTRCHGDTLQNFHEGSLKIAEKSECPIIPIAFRGTDDLYENSKPFVRKAAVTITIGAPIQTEGLSRQEYHSLSEKVKATLQELYEKE